MHINMVLKHKRQTDGSSKQISLTKKSKDCPEYVGNAGKHRVISRLFKTGTKQCVIYLDQLSPNICEKTSTFAKN